MSSTASVLFLHGLEGTTSGSKARWLAEHYGAHAVDLNTEAAIASSRAAVDRGQAWSHESPDIEEAFRVPLERARAAIGPATRLIVGSSFGGAVLMHLVQARSWTGPCLFIASAGTKLTGHGVLPPDVDAILLHGRHDDIVDIEDSRTVAANGGLNVQLWEIGDIHPMRQILETGILRAAVEFLMKESG